MQEIYLPDLLTQNYVCISAYFQHGLPIYSAKAVRFRMGYPKNPKELKSAVAGNPNVKQMLRGKRFVWTYTSPGFPMAQVCCTVQVW